MKISGNIEKEDVFHLLTHNIKKNKRPKVIYLVAFLYPFMLWGAVTRLQEGTYRISDIMLIVAPVLITIFLILSLKKTASRIYGMQYKNENPVTVSITIESIQVSTNRHNSVYSWSDVKDVVKGKHMIIFGLATKTYFSIPKHWFADINEYEIFFAQINEFANQRVDPTVKTPVESGND